MFTPRREHVRFCSARCRIDWHGRKPGDRTAEMSALGWSLAAMCEATGRLSRVQAGDRSRAGWVVGDAVWWVTIVDATLVRYHPEAYDCVLARRAAAEHRLIEDTLAGLRFVRNQMGREVDHVDFICPAGSGPGDGCVAAWTWNPVPEPVPGPCLPRGQQWEMTRYRAYQAQLASRPVGTVFRRATAFLDLAIAQAASVPHVSTRAAT
jgi:hypothetical protein